MKIFVLLLCPTLALAGETKIKLTDAPPAVQKTIKEKGQGAKLKRVLKDTKKDAPIYEAEFTVAGHSKDISMDANGNVVEIEEIVPLDTLPVHARKAIVDAAAGGKVKSVEAISHGGAVEYYEAAIKKKGSKTSEIKVDPEGKPVAD